MKNALLILDLNMNNREAIRQLFIEGRYQVTLTESIQNALAIGKKIAPQIVVYDFSLPSEDATVMVALLEFEFPTSKLVIINARLPRYLNNKISFGERKIVLTSSSVFEIYSMVKRIERQEIESDLMC